MAVGGRCNKRSGEPIIRFAMCFRFRNKVSVRNFDDVSGVGEARFLYYLTHVARLDARPLRREQ